MIVMGFDFGMKHIGVAVGQSITKTATPVASLSAKDGIPNWDEIQALILKWQATELIVGIPLNMDGTPQPMSFAAKKFGKRLHAKFKLPVFHVDERLSSWEAKQRLNIKQDKDYKMTQKEKEAVNAESAVILVEQWLKM